MFGRKSPFEKELAQRVGAERAADIVKELGSELVNSALLKKLAGDAAEIVATIVRFKGPGASAHEIAREFVTQLKRGVDEMG